MAYCDATTDGGGWTYLGDQQRRPANTGQLAGAVAQQLESTTAFGTLDRCSTRTTARRRSTGWQGGR